MTNFDLVLAELHRQNYRVTALCEVFVQNMGWQWQCSVMPDPKHNQPYVNGHPKDEAVVGRGHLPFTAMRNTLAQVAPDVFKEEMRAMA